MKTAAIKWFIAFCVMFCMGLGDLSAAAKVEVALKSMVNEGDVKTHAHQRPHALRLTSGEAFVNLELPPDLMGEVLGFVNWLKKKRQEEVSTFFDLSYDVKARGRGNLIQMLEKAQGMEVNAHFYNLTLKDLGAITHYASCFRSFRTERSMLGDGAVSLLSSPTFSNLTSLDLQFAGITRQGFEKILKAPLMQSVTSLCLQGNTIGDQAVAGLAAFYKGSPRLDRLNLSHCGLTSAGVKSLVEVFGESPRLTALWLVGNDLGSTGIQFLSSASWPGLASLHLGLSKLQNTDVQALLKARQGGKLKNLKCLFIPRNELTPGIGATLVEWEKLGVYVPKPL